MSTRGRRSLLGLSAAWGLWEGGRMSHLRPLTVAWSSGGVGVSGGQPREFAGRGARTSCSDPQHRRPAHAPPQPAAPAAGRRCSEASKQGARGPTSATAGLPAPLRPCWSQLTLLLCGAVVCYFLPSPVRAPEASRPAAEDAPRSCREQQVFSGSKPLCQPVSATPLLPMPSLTALAVRGPAPQHPLLQVL